MRSAFSNAVRGSLVLLASAACSDGTTSPTEKPTFSAVQQILTQDCSSCHNAGSGRFFLVTMDSAQLQQSGLIDPVNLAQSLLLLKPTGAIPHGGGAVAAFTAEHQAVVSDWAALLPPAPPSLVEAVKVGTGTTIPAPTVDGFYDVVWGVAAPVLLRVSGGWGEAEFVSARAAYDGTYLYMLLVWDDDKASVRRQPWVKQADGTWATLAAKLPAPTTGLTWNGYLGTADEEDPARFNYEDKFAMMWNTYGAGNVAGFDQTGCAVTCHDPAQGNRPGTSYHASEAWSAAKKYTNAVNEIADLWHWKLVRNNQHAKADDQYVRYWVPGAAGAADGGRASDAGASGYGNNPAFNGRPQYRGATAAAPPYYIFDNQKVQLSDADVAAMPVGTVIANMITSGPTLGRGDIDAKGLWNSGTWVLEVRRKLVTTDATDVQFDDLNRQYAFGVAVFDNAQIEHRYSSMVAKLGFKP